MIANPESKELSLLKEVKRGPRSGVEHRNYGGRCEQHCTNTLLEVEVLQIMVFN